jgi:hypothetical protein
VRARVFTTKTPRDPIQEKPQITQMNADILFTLDRVSASSTNSCHPSIFSNAKTQRRKDAKPTYLSRRSREVVKPDPPHSQRRDAETQRRRGALAGFLCVARSRPSDDGRESLGQETAPKTSLRSNFLAQRPALSEHRPRHFSSSFNSWETYTTLPNREEARHNLGATGRSAVEKTDNYGCLHPEWRDFSTATGDHSIACRSAVKKRDRLSDSVTNSLRLCVFAPLRFLRWGDGSALICVICGFFGCAGGSAPLRFSWCSPLMSWCLGGAETLAFLA